LEKAEGDKQAIIRTMMETYKNTFDLERHRIDQDRKRIMDVVRHCNVIRQNSLTNVTDNGKVTCNPIKLRDRIHSIVNTVYVDIRKLRNHIKVSKRRLKSVKTADNKNVLEEGIKKYESELKEKRAFVTKNRENLKETVDICKQYGFYVKTFVELKQYSADE